MSTLLTMEGRIGRQQYVLLTTAVVIATYFLAFVAGFVLGLAGSAEGATVVGFLIGLAGAVIQAFLVIRRLHDMGKPSWHYWLFFIPLYNLYLGLILLFTPGDSDTNDFGVNPVSA